MNKYLDIQNLDDLNAAIRRSEKVVASREKQLKRRFDKARQFYTPSAFVAEGARKLVSNLSLPEMALTLLRLIRGKK